MFIEREVEIFTFKDELFFNLAIAITPLMKPCDRLKVMENIRYECRDPVIPVDTSIIRESDKKK
jgi:hypothetical protein